jgi:hypothetical protein
MDGIELRGNYRIIGYRQDLLHALDRKHAAAYVVSALLRWTTNKREELVRLITRRAENKQPPLSEKDLEIWIHMSYEEFSDEFDGLFSHNTIKDAVLYLITKDLIFQRKNRNPRFKDYEYRVNLPEVRKLVQALPSNPEVRQRDNRNRKRVTKKGDTENESPKLATSPELADGAPNLVDVTPELVAESPELANHYTMSTQSLSNTTQNKCVEASDSSTETVLHTPKNNDLDPLGMEMPETPLPVREIVTEELLENLPWGAKKALDTTEAIVNTTYTNVDATLRTCQKILDTYHPTEEEYIGVVSKAIVWYEANGRILEPKNLLAYNKEGRVWFEVFLGEFKRYGFNGKPVFSQRQEAEPYIATNSEVVDELPEQYIVSIEEMAKDFICEEQYIDPSINNIEGVYQPAMRLGVSLEEFDTTFTWYLNKAYGLNPEQVLAMKYDDHLDLLCRSMQATLAKWEQGVRYTSVVESDLVTQQ